MFRNVITEEQMVSLGFTIAPNIAEKVYFKVDCLSGKTLKAFVEDGLTDFLIAISIDDITYTNAFTTGIDLTPYTGTKQIIIARITSPNQMTLLTENIIWKLV